MDVLLHLSLSLGLASLCCGALGFYGYALYSTLNYWLQSETVPYSEFQPPVTLLKRLRRLDPATQASLVSLCQQHYPTYQILFLVEDGATAAIDTVGKLIQQFPERDIQLIVSSQPLDNHAWGPGLIQATTLARYDLWVLIDPDIQVGPDYLHQLVQPFRYPGVGIVTCPSRWQSHDWATALAAIGTVTDLYPGLLVTRQREGVHFTLGGTLALRRALLDQPACLDSLAAQQSQHISDLRLGRLPAIHGYRVVLSGYVVEQIGERPTADSWIEGVRRHFRSIQDLHATRPELYWLKGITYGTLSSSLLLLVTHGAALAWALCGLTWMLRLLLGSVMSFVLCDRTIRRYFWLLPVWDLLSFGVWCWLSVPSATLRTQHPSPSGLAKPSASPALGSATLLDAGVR
ncbi:MAG: glycosyltransferase [Synechococcales cyanobacterium M58_A2018_015]|nr:glycosyltransferase [Synechococcales cyanobacterium M58_A2018_015]